MAGAWGGWLLERFTILGIQFQNWMIPAAMMIAVAAVLYAWISNRSENSN
jgi:hypothetical protein